MISRARENPGFLFGNIYYCATFGAPNIDDISVLIAHNKNTQVYRNTITVKVTVPMSNSAAFFQLNSLPGKIF